MHEEEKGEVAYRSSTPLDGALDSLRGQTDRLEHIVDSFIGRLSIVLRPSEPSAGRGDTLAQVRSTSPVVDAIETIVNRLGALADRLNETSDRLDT